MSIENNPLNPIQLTPELVGSVMSDLKKHDPKYRWGQGEFRNSVFELLMIRFKLPWVNSSVGEVPNFKDPKVQELDRELDKFKELLESF